MITRVARWVSFYTPKSLKNAPNLSRSRKFNECGDNYYMAPTQKYYVLLPTTCLLKRSDA